METTYLLGDYRRFNLELFYAMDSEKPTFGRLILDADMDTVYLIR